MSPGGHLFVLVLVTFYSATALFSPEDIADSDSLHTYIVHVDPAADTGRATPPTWEELNRRYAFFLPTSTTANVGTPDSPHPRLVHSYRSVISGFAAKLTAAEVKTMAAKEGFVGAHRQRTLRLQTTRTPGFLGLYPNTTIWQNSNLGSGTIIGVLDTGIYPSHLSFSDRGMPVAKPARWKGSCDFRQGCNGKIIGARNLVDGSDAPMDLEGHGTHVASIAAGNFVPGAHQRGHAYGSASGMAPLAYLAIYQVCNRTQCQDSDVLKGFDTAIEDGVDVLSVSIGGETGIPLYKDVIAVGSFRATQKGIFVSLSAGNSGPLSGTVLNDFPWALTVGASTVDRNIRATATLGNSETIDGESLNRRDQSLPPTPLIYPGSVGGALAETRFCASGSLEGINVTGMVVLCDQGGRVQMGTKAYEVERAGGAATLVVNSQLAGETTLAQSYDDILFMHAGYEAGSVVRGYLNSTLQPTASIVYKGTVLGVPDAPAVAFFSSRGPSTRNQRVLKPDIIGPGVDILAAWPFGTEDDVESETAFRMTAGTSESCPHLSGVAALIKSLHFGWSPAAIKSAIMTSAEQVTREYKPIPDEALNPASVLAMGSGQVNPEGARDPGLVYDVAPNDYLGYVCGLGYGDAEVGIMWGGKVSCSAVRAVAGGQVNLPSFSVALGRGDRRVSYTRTVTNVGQANRVTYVGSVSGVRGFRVRVRPSVLKFRRVGQKKTYAVTVRRVRVAAAGHGNSSDVQLAEGFLRWVPLAGTGTGTGIVKSPIVVHYAN